MTVAVTASERGHDVTIFERNSTLGGQFNFAKVIPGKEEFFETIRYYRNMIEKLNIKVQLSHDVSDEFLKNSDLTTLSSPQGSCHAKCDLTALICHRL